MKKSVVALLHFVTERTREVLNYSVVAMAMKKSEQTEGIMYEDASTNPLTFQWAESCIERKISQFSTESPLSSIYVSSVLGAFQIIQFNGILKKGNCLNDAFLVGAQTLCVEPFLQVWEQRTLGTYP